MKTAIYNGKLITPVEVLENKVLVLENDRIIDILAEDVIDLGQYDEKIDAHGRYVCPGFIDTHSDKIEQIIQPRPTSVMDFEMGLKEIERQLINQGITTIYHSISLYQDDYFGASELRYKKNVLKLAELINNIHERHHLIHHRLHLRIEIDNLEAFDIVSKMLREKTVHEISFMDHTPGQGQYRNIETYRKTITAYHGETVTTLGFEGVLEHHKNKRTLSFEQLHELAELARANGIPAASHDDDTAAKLQVNKELGVAISEFPTTIDVARQAQQLGLATVVGAPNILLGGSHTGNLSAAEAVKKGCADILCSDYYPAAMLHSIFIMHEQHGVPLPEIVNKLTLNPARAMCIDNDYGSLAVGKKADLLIIKILDGYPVITHALVDGKVISQLEYRV